MLQKSKLLLVDFFQGIEKLVLYQIPVGDPHKDVKARAMLPIG
jgi:hypothetical protein